MQNRSLNEVPVYQWSETLLAFEIISIGLLVTATWIFISIVVYGTKTKRWTKKPGTSSLNCGLIYSVCTLSVLLTLPRLAITEYLYVLPRLGDKMHLCELMCDVDNLLYSVAMYSTYVFMWLLQRKIYTHPYVKPKIGAVINWVSRVFGIFLALAAIGLTLSYVMFNSYKPDEHGHACVLTLPENGTFIEGLGKNIIVVASLVLSQGIILFLLVYPIVQVKFDLGNAASDSLEDSVFTDATEPTKKKSPKIRKILNSCFRRRHNMIKNPIEITARRAMVSGIIMVSTDVIALTVAFLALPVDAPVVLRQTVYDIANIANVFCVVSSLGLAPKILGLFCPNCSEVIRRRSRTNNVFEYGMGDDTNRSEEIVQNKVSPRDS